MAELTKIPKSEIPDLPQELLQNISKRIDTESDVVRFRSVCTSWRRSTPPPKKKPCINLPFPFSHSERNLCENHGAYFKLIERTVYRFESPQIENPNCWIVKIERLEDGKIRILNPVSNKKIKIGRESQLPEVLNTLNFRVFEVCKSYSLAYVNPKYPKSYDYRQYAKKVAISFSKDDNSYVAMAIDENDYMWYIKSGEEKWTKAPECWGNYVFADVVSYKGQFHTVVHAGATFVFDSSFDVTRITSYIYSPASSKRHLVELYGELYLVCEVTDKDKIECKCYEPEDGCMCGASRIRFKNTAVEIKIYKMDRSDTSWVEVDMKNLEARTIFLGDDCSFSFHATDSTRVFYTDRFIFFRTKEEKKTHDHNSFEDDCYDFDNSCEYDGEDANWGNGYGYGYGYGYDYCGCDCSDSSSDEKESDNYVASDDVKAKFRGLDGHNIGVCDFESGDIGSVLRFPEYADIFCPPPSWICNN